MTLSYFSVTTFIYTDAVGLALSLLKVVMPNTDFEAPEGHQSQEKRRPLLNRRQSLRIADFLGAHDGLLVDGPSRKRYSHAVC